MLSQSSPSLNRFPGLTLVAWGLIIDRNLVKGFNVGSVVYESWGAMRTDLSVPVGAAVAVDASAAAGITWTVNGGGKSLLFSGPGGAAMPDSFYFAAYK